MKRGLIIGIFVFLILGVSFVYALSTDNDLSLGTGNNQRFIIHSTQGWNPPGQILQITNDKSNGDYDWSQGIVLKRGGNVGIGTINPQAKLDVRANGPIDGIKIHGQNPRLLFGDNAFYPAAAIGTLNDGRLAFWAAKSSNEGADPSTTPYLVIGYGGTVGIGTASPSEKLEIFSDKACVGGSSGKIEFSDGSERVRIGIDRTVCDEGADMVFETEGNNGVVYERMRIAKSGNVGIGTDKPTAKLDVNGNAIFRGNVEVQGKALVQKICFPDGSCLDSASV